MDKKSWLQKLETMDQDQQEAPRSAQQKAGSLDFLEGRGKLLVLGGIGLVVLALLLVVFSPGRDAPSEKQFQDILARLETLESRLVGLENQESGRQQSMVRLQGDFGILTMRVDKLSREMKEQFSELKAKQTPPGPAPRPVAQPAAPAKLAETAPARPAAATQDKPVLHEVRSGDTLFSISRTYGVPVEEIRRLNQIGADNVIRSGQVLTIKQ